MRAALLGLLLAAAAVAPAFAQTLQGPDLAVVRLTLDAVPAWTDGQPSGTQVRVRIENTGTSSAAYRIEYTWVPDGGEPMPLNGDPHTSFDVGESLAPRAGRDHYAPWALVAGQEGPGQVVATVLAASATETDPSDDERAQALFIPRRSISLAELSNETMDIPPDATRFVRVPVTNHGNHEAPVAVRVIALQPPEPRLEIDVEPPVLRVPAGQTANATVFVRFAPAGDLDPFATVLRVAADPGYGNPPNTTTGLVRDAPAQGTQGYAFDLGPSGLPTLHVPVDRDAAQVLRLRNLGSRADDYTLAAVAPAGWTASFEPDRVALGPGEAGDVALRLRAAASDPLGTPASISVEARSGSAGTRALLDVPARRAGPGLRLDEVRLPVMYVGDAASAEVRVANDGDADAPAGLLRLAVGLPEGGEQAALASSPVVAAGQAATVKVPLPPLQRGGLLRAEATLQPASGLHVPAPASATGRVRAPGVDVDAPTAAEGMPGETVAYLLPPRSFAVANTGAETERFRLVATASAGQARVLGPEFIELAPGERRSVAVAHELPKPSGALAAADLTLTVEHALRPLRWNATVATGIVDRNPPAIAIAVPQHPAAGANLTVRLDASDDGRLANVTLNVTGPDGVARALPTHRAGDAWQAWWTPERGGPHVLRAAARDAAGNAAAARADAAVANATPPALAWSNPAPALRPDATLTFNVTDPAGIATVQATLAQGGRLRTVTATLDGSTVAVPLDGAQEGPAQLTVVATNRLGVAAATTVEFTVSKDAPAEPAGTPAREGAPALAAAAALAALAAAAARRRLRR